MRLYSTYIKQVRGLDTVSGAHGFVTYLLHEKECYIEDVYIEDEKRKLGIGKKLMDEVLDIAKKHGCASLFATVTTRIRDPEISLMACFSYGFRILSASSDTILLKMEI